MVSFAKYAAIENLLVDNGWVLAGKPHAARMLGGLFRERGKSGKLTVVASDLPLANLGSEIAELFADAVVIDLEQKKTPPDQLSADPAAFSYG